MRPVGVKSSTYINILLSKIMKKILNLKTGDIVRISKYKTIFAKDYTQNWSEEVFVINKDKNTLSRTYVINDINGEEIVETFYEKWLQKNQSKRIQNWRSNKEIRRWIVC